MAGTRWKIGPGDMVSIKGKPWLLLDEDNPFVTTTNQVLENRKVASLMCVDRREWDKDLIRDVFNSRDQEGILRIPLIDTNHQDVLY